MYTLCFDIFKVECKRNMKITKDALPKSRWFRNNAQKACRYAEHVETILQTMAKTLKIGLSRNNKMLLLCQKKLQIKNKQLPKKTIVKFINLNASFRLKCEKLQKILLLPVTSKLYKKILVKRLNHLIEENNLFPCHQFGSVHHWLSR